MLTGVLAGVVGGVLTGVVAGLVVLAAGEVGAVAALLEARLGTAPEISVESGTVSTAVENGRRLPEIVRQIDAANIELAEFALRRASLDEVFLALTGQPAEPSAATTTETPELNGSTR